VDVLRDYHLIANVGTIAREAVCEVLRATEQRKPGRLAESVRERRHEAHMAAHALAALLRRRGMPENVWHALADGIRPVCTRTADLLRQHTREEFRPGDHDNHTAHALADAAMAIALYRERALFEEVER